MTLHAVTQHLRSPEATYPSVVVLPDDARSMGIYLLAGRGSGKSRLMGRVISWQDFIRRKPQVILDPNSQTIANFLDKVARLSPERRAVAHSRIRYIDMGSRTHAVPWPLYIRYEGESLFEVSQRFLEVVKRLDPALVSASIQGWNSLSEIGTFTGMILAALGWQITEAASLIATPERYTGVLTDLAARESEARDAVAYFLQVLPSLKPAEKERKVGAFLRKIAVFTLDPVMHAMFGANIEGVDWSQVVARGETVLIDFGQVLDLERRRFLMLWIFQSFLSFLRRRGPGRHAPIGFIIDELTALYNFDVQAGSSIFAADLDHLINVLARNYRAHLTLSHQELFQVDWKTQKTLLGMGTKIIGVTTDSEAALTLARELFPFDPTLISRFEPVYDSRGTLIDANPVYWSSQEQQLLAARRFRNMQPFNFLVKASSGEGNATGALVPLSIANIDKGIWVDETAVGALKRELMAQNGIPIERLFEVAALRQQQAQSIVTPRQENFSREEIPTHDRLNGDVRSLSTDDFIALFNENAEG